MKLWRRFVVVQDSMLTDFGKLLALLWLGVSCSYANEYPRVDAVKGTENIEFIDGEYFVKYVVYARNDDGKVEKMNAFVQVFPKNAKAIKAGAELLAITKKQFGWNWECQLVDAGQAIVRRVTRKCPLLFHGDPYVLARVIPSLHFSVIQGEYNNKFDELKNDVNAVIKNVCPVADDIALSIAESIVTYYEPMIIKMKKNRKKVR